MTTKARNTNDKQQALAIALGAAAAYVCLPADSRKTSGWLTDMAHAVRSWGYERLPEAEFAVQFYGALQRSGFVDHLRGGVAARDALAEHGPFEVTPGALGELLAALAGDDQGA